MVVALCFGLLLVGGTGPAVSMIDAAATGLTMSVVDEQAVEVSAARVVRRRIASRSIRRTAFGVLALMTTTTSRLQSLLTHRWSPDRQLSPPLWRGPPAFAL